MSKGQGVVRRLLIRACPQFLEDWFGIAGDVFRDGVEKVSDYNAEHAKLGEKLDAAPGMIWRAAEGATSAQHARAEADYAKAESDRMDAELRRRTMEAKTRHECADADKAEAEAGIAKIRQVQARLELFKQLKDLGVAVTVDSEFNLRMEQAVPARELQAPDVIESEELPAILPKVVEVRCPSAGADNIEYTFHRWLVSVGCRVALNEPVAEVWTMQSPPSFLTIPAPAAGVVVATFAPGKETVIRPGQTIATILEDA